MAKKKTDAPKYTREERELLKALAECPEDVLTEDEAAEYLRWSAVNLRHRRNGHVPGPCPRWARLPGSRSIRYLKSWLIEFVESGEVKSAAGE